MKLLNEITIAVCEGSSRRAKDLISRAFDENHSPETILRKGLVPGMLQAEKKFSRGEIPDSEFILCERTMKAGMEMLTPLIKNGKNPAQGLVITGTLEGDIRETGKDILSALMQGLNLRVIDLGSSVPVYRFIDTAKEEKAKLIACTTSMTAFLPQMKALVQAAICAKIRDETKILISGRPVTARFGKKIDADMYAPDPVQAAEIAAEYCAKL